MVKKMTVIYYLLIEGTAMTNIQCHSFLYNKLQHGIMITVMWSTLTLVCMEKEQSACR